MVWPKSTYHSTILGMRCTLGSGSIEIGCIEATHTHTVFMYDVDAHTQTKGYYIPCLLHGENVNKPHTTGLYQGGVAKLYPMLQAVMKCSFNRKV